MVVIQYSTEQREPIGGQHVGCGPVGIHGLHEPTGLTAFCNYHRSQHKNRLAVESMICYGLAELGLLKIYDK